MTYTLIRSRRKTLAIYIKPDGSVEVRAPLKLAKSKIDEFITSKSAWIEKKQAQITPPSELRDLPLSQYAKGDFERVTLKIVKEWEQKLGVVTSFVGIRSMSSRWGSCTAKTRRIRLNSALEYCPRECLEYVIVHELAHLRESNHSARFWAIVENALPNYKTQKEKLKEYQWVLNIR
ncbi:hypothetical protein FACS1894132_11280 [Clostridia bacterium]|nr:hypothetical protein FACS1894132_11280 [Clostridia bacterium]